jgi:lipopolysaccharide/colanic/teichoic acid biosynthesis glycosyltransferase
MHLHTDDDLYYVYNYSLLLDLWILLRTPIAVLRGKGAF